MRAKLTTKPLQALIPLKTGYSRQGKATTLGKLMISKQTCPCCSNTLLRHMGLGGLY